MTTEDQHEDAPAPRPEPTSDTPDHADTPDAPAAHAEAAPEPTPPETPAADEGDHEAPAADAAPAETPAPAEDASAEDAPPLDEAAAEAMMRDVSNVVAQMDAAMAQMHSMLAGVQDQVGDVEGMTSRLEDAALAQTHRALLAQVDDLENKARALKSASDAPMAAWTGGDSPQPAEVDTPQQTTPAPSEPPAEHAEPDTSETHDEASANTRARTDEHEHDDAEADDGTEADDDAPPKRGHHTLLDYHRGLLDDPFRMDAYERALRTLIKPGDVVLDLGCGTGVFAMLAAQRGAARAYGVEVTPVARLARTLVAHNGLDDQVTILEADAVELDPVEPVDLIVSDFMGRFVVDDAMLDAVEASAAWLKPGGRYCPNAVDMWVAPVGDFQFWALDFYKRSVYGLDFSPGLTYAMNTCYRAQLLPSATLSDPQRLARIEPPKPSPAFDTTFTFEVERDGHLQALAGWFTATLAPDVVLSTGPGTETHWGQYLFPLPPCKVDEGDLIEAHLRLDRTPADERDAIWRWSGRVLRDGAVLATFDQESEQRLGEREEGRDDA